MSRDYLGNRCAFVAPYGGKCSLKRTNQAFAFIALCVHPHTPVTHPFPYSMLICTSSFCTLVSAALEVRNLWLHRAQTNRGFQTKEVPRQSADTGVTGTTAGVGAPERAV